MGGRPVHPIFVFCTEFEYFFVKLWYFKAVEKENAFNQFVIHGLHHGARAES